MNQILYKITFDGVMAPGISREEVEANLASMFGFNAAKIDHLLSGDTIVLKSGLSEEEATHYLQDLRKAGLMARKIREIHEKIPARTPLSLAEEPAKPEPKPESEPKPEASQWDSPADFWGTSATPPPAPVLPRQEEPAQDYTQNRVIQNGLIYRDSGYCELKFFSLEGRLGRIRFIGWPVGGSMLMVIIAVLPFALLAAVSRVLAGILAVLLVFILFSFIFILHVRRLHDCNLSGWWLLLFLVPLVNCVFPLFLYLKAGTDGPNNYGPPPPPNSLGAILLATLSIIFSIILFVEGFHAGLTGTRTENPWSSSVRGLPGRR